MKKYVIHYEGMAFIEAEDEESAKECFGSGDTVIDDKVIAAVEEVDEFDFSSL